MNKSLKFKTEKEKLFFSSDWHVYHQRPWVVEDVGYSSIEERADNIRSAVNSTVGKDGTLFFLGDGFLNSTVEMAVGFLNTLNVKRIYYLWGNHESPLGRLYRNDMSSLRNVITYHGDEQASRGIDPKVLEVYPWTSDTIPHVTFLGNYQKIYIDNKSVVLNHFPIDVFDHQNRNGYMLCGHSHYNFPKTRAAFPRGKRLDVGWCGHKRILSWEDINLIMQSKEFLPEDHHE